MREPGLSILSSRPTMRFYRGAGRAATPVTTPRSSPAISRIRSGVTSP